MGSAVTQHHGAVRKVAEPRLESALFARRRGQANGQRVAVNLLDGGIMLSSEWFTRYAGRPERPLADRGQHGPSPWHRLYACSDGYVYVAADSTDQRAAFVDALGLSDALPSDETTGDIHPNDTPFGIAAAAAFAKLDRVAACALLEAASIPFAPALAPHSTVFFDDPHTAINGWSVTRQHPSAGTLTAVCRYLKFEGVGNNTDVIAPTPLLGQQTDAVLAEAGYDAEEIAKLRGDDLVVTRTTGP